MKLLSLLAVMLVGFSFALPAAAGAEKLRVATFNIRYGTAKDGEDHWDKRKELVFRTIKEMDCDVIGMQEALAFQVDAIAQAVPGYEHVMAGREDGKRGGESVPIFYRAERFEKLAAGHFWLSETPEKVASRGWDAALPRITTWVRLRDKRVADGQPGRDVLVVNTHFDHKGQQARVESAKLLRKWIDDNRARLPVVLLGDFNATEDQEPYATLRGKEHDHVGLVDAFRALHPQPGEDEATFNGFKGTRKGRRIDWIFHSHDFKPLKCEIVRTSDGDRYPSDHYPVTAELSR